MTRRCAWCKLVMGEKPPPDDRSVTYGICGGCRRAALAETQPVSSANRDEVYYPHRKFTPPTEERR